MPALNLVALSPVRARAWGWGTRGARHASTRAPGCPTRTGSVTTHACPRLVDPRPQLQASVQQAIGPAPPNGPPPATTGAASSPAGGLSGGAIAGIVLGGVAALALITGAVVGAVLAARRSKRAARPAARPAAIELSAAGVGGTAPGADATQRAAAVEQAECAKRRAARAEFLPTAAARDELPTALKPEAAAAATHVPSGSSTTTGSRASTPPAPAAAGAPEPSV